MASDATPRGGIENMEDRGEEGMGRRVDTSVWEYMASAKWQGC